jgi:hypothetical protein
MRKLKKSAVWLAVIAVCAALILWSMQLYLTQTGLHRANERGLHYGPSEEILLARTGERGHGIVVSKCGDEGLSVTETMRRFGLLYHLDDGGITGYLPCGAPAAVFYNSSCDLLFGIVFGGDAASVRLYYSTDGSAPADPPLFYDVVPDGNGFFFVEDAALGLGLVPDHAQDRYFYWYPYAEAFASDGTLLFTSRDAR